MDKIGIRELKTHASEILRRVRENNETIAITYRGEVVARLEPVPQGRVASDDMTDYWAELDQLVADIAKKTPPHMSAADVMRDVRRDL